MSESPHALPGGTDGPCLVGGCTRLAAYPLTVCAVDGRAAAQRVATLAAEYERLDAAPALGVWSREPGVSGGSPKSWRSPVNLDVLVARDPRSSLRAEGDPEGNTAPGVLAFALGWAALVAEEFADCAPPRELRAARALLVEHLWTLLAHEAAGEFCAELRAAHEAMQRINATQVIPTPRRGRCRAVRDGVTCGGPLDWDGRAASCTRCAGTWSGLAVLTGGAA